MNIDSNNQNSDWNISQLLNFEMKVEYILNHKSGDGHYSLKFPIFNEEAPYEVKTDDNIIYQSGELRNIDLNNENGTLIEFQDQFMNSYFYINTSLKLGNKLTFKQTYNLFTKEINFEGLKDSEIEIPNTYNKIYELYCTTSNQYYNKSDPELISIAQIIQNDANSIIEKAQKTSDWINSYLNYDPNLNNEKGASWAFDNKRGDCSEFSSLMITLLRIQNIPARKVCGFILEPEINHILQVGDTWTFYQGNTELSPRTSNQHNFLKHVWVEYYVPNTGWIACDPLYHQNHHESINQIDALRISSNIGEWFECPCNPIDHNRSELILYDSCYSVDNTFDELYQITLTLSAIEMNLDKFIILIIMSEIIGTIVISIAFVYKVKDKRNQKKVYTFKEYNRFPL